MQSPPLSTQGPQEALAGNREAIPGRSGAMVAQRWGGRWALLLVMFVMTRSSLFFAPAGYTTRFK